MEDGPPDGPQTQKNEVCFFHVSLVNLILLAYIESILPSGIVVPLTSVQKRYELQRPCNGFPGRRGQFSVRKIANV